jgi:hypothetical protein
MTPGGSPHAVVLPCATTLCLLDDSGRVLGESRFRGGRGLTFDFRVSSCLATFRRWVGCIVRDLLSATMWIFIGGEYLLERLTAGEICPAGRSCYGRRSNGSHTVAPGFILPSRQTREWPSGAAGRPWGPGGVRCVTQKRLTGAGRQSPDVTASLWVTAERHIRLPVKSTSLGQLAWS